MILAFDSDARQAGRLDIPIAVAILLLFAATPLPAHHGSAPHFDPDVQVDVEGVVTELRFVNPHAFVHFDVIDANGESVPWRCELAGATLLRRQGWTPETLFAGQRIQMVGALARREANSCAMRTITLEDGSVISSRGLQQADLRPVADPADVAQRPRYLDNGQPNISGAWVSREPGGSGGILTNGPAEPTEAGLAAAESFDVRYDNPVINCESGNIITDWYRQSHVNDIRQMDDRIIVRHGYLEMERTIFLNAEHPQDLAPSVTGHSVGAWEDDVLVVDTVGLAERVLIPLRDVMMSDQARVVERIHYDPESRTLVRDYTVEDPLYLAKPYSGRNVSDIAAEPYQPFDCVNLSGENNRRPEPGE